MKILLLGGTGAMGYHLTSILAGAGHELYITSRSNRESCQNVHFIQGNAHDSHFLNYVLGYTSWDCIVDFMHYKTEQFRGRITKVLKSTQQYIFLSSSRVYADSKTPIVETSPRLLDVSTDERFLSTDEYALAKAREENILFEHKYKNWTIVRPYITYSEQRLQLGVLEKESWLWAALNLGVVIFSKDIACHVTTLTYGYDVARGIAALIGESEAIGEVFHITCNRQIKWEEVFEIYNRTLSSEGFNAMPVYKDRTSRLQSPGKYQVVYDRYYDRVFDNSKINRFIDTGSFKTPEEGLTECLRRFLKSSEFKRFDIESLLMLTKDSGVRIKLSQIGRKKDKIKFILIKTHLIKIVRYGKLLFSGKTDSNSYRSA